MRVASFELCRELDELGASDWWRADYGWQVRFENGAMLQTDDKPRPYQPCDIPAYDLDYLLDKLPATIPNDIENPSKRSGLTIVKRRAGYRAYYMHRPDPSFAADAAADAAAMVAIKLIKGGELLPEAGS